MSHDLLVQMAYLAGERRRQTQAFVDLTASSSSKSFMAEIWQKAREIWLRLIQLVPTHWRSLHPLVMRQKVIVT